MLSARTRKLLVTHAVSRLVSRRRGLVVVVVVVAIAADAVSWSSRLNVSTVNPR